MAMNTVLGFADLLLLGSFLAGDIPLSEEGLRAPGAHTFSTMSGMDI
jgi:hypothetical protein